MVDSKAMTGGRDDLRIDCSRCLRMRFSESACRRCMHSCPHGAVTLDDGLDINPALCRGCLLCTSVCPVGALEQKNDFTACIAKLSKVQEPVLGCVGTSDGSNGIVACLGGLSEEHLLTLFHSLTGRLTLNLSLCSDCPNNPITAELGQRLNSLDEAGLSNGGCSIVLAEAGVDIHFSNEAVNRRGFFKSFRNSLLKGAADFLSASAPGQQAEKRSEYAAKRLPVRRELLNSSRISLSPEMQTRLQNFFDSSISCNESCSRCQGCVAICPTGALQTSSTEELPVFDHLRCSGCGLCVEFCLDGAVRISHVKEMQTI